MTTEQIEPGYSNAHRICKLLRELRQSAGWSLSMVEKKFNISPVVLGAYERGDRTPPLPKLERVLAIYGYELQAVPVGTTYVRKGADIAEELRAIADQIEEQNALLALS